MGQRNWLVADIVEIEEVVLHCGEDVRGGIVYDFDIEIVYLALDVIGKIPGILVIDGAHDDFDFVDGLLVHHVAFRLTPVVDFLADKDLEALHVF